MAARPVVRCLTPFQSVQSSAAVRYWLVVDEMCGSVVMCTCGHAIELELGKRVLFTARHCNTNPRARDLQDEQIATGAADCRQRSSSRQARAPAPCPQASGGPEDAKSAPHAFATSENVLRLSAFVIPGSARLACVHAPRSERSARPSGTPSAPCKQHSRKKNAFS